MSLFRKDGGHVSGVPLKRVHVRGVLREHVAEVTVESHFVNTTHDALEIEYHFPLHERAVLSGMKARVGDVSITAVCKEKRTAEAHYDDAVAEGRAAFLVAKRGDVYVMSLGNVDPDVPVTVSVGYVSELAVDAAGHMCFVLANGVAPDDAVDPDDIPADAGAHAEDSGAPFRLLDGDDFTGGAFGMTMALRLAVSGVEAVHCTSGHAVVVDRALETVTLGSPVPLSRDLALHIALRDATAPRCVLERTEVDGEAHYAAMVSFVPRVPDALRGAVHTEMVFVVDRSGSMSGDPMRRTIAALHRCLDVLPRTATFNVISFGSRTEMMWPGALPATRAHVARAKTLIDDFTANLGGTNLAPALESAFTLPTDAHVVRQLVVLTDGCISDEQGTFTLLRARSNATRVYSFGIGNNVSRNLVRGLAAAGGGTCAIVRDTSELDSVVPEHVHRALSACITDASLQTDIAHERMAPLLTRPAFHNTHWRTFLLGVEMDASAAGTVTLHGVLPNGEPVSFSVLVDGGDVAEGTAIHSLAAGEAIRDLEGGLYGDATDATVRERIVELGVRFQVASSCTSFVASVARAQPIVAVPACTTVPQYTRSTAPTLSFGATTGCGGGGAAPSVPNHGDNHKRLRAAAAAVAATEGHRSERKRARRGEAPTGVHAGRSPFGFAGVPVPTDAASEFGAFRSVVKGLRNRYSSCWMDATLALVLSVAPLREALLSPGAEKTAVPLVRAVGDLARAWVRTDHRVRSQLRRKLRKFGTRVQTAFAAHGFAMHEDHSVGAALTCLLAQLAACNAPWASAALRDVAVVRADSAAALARALATARSTARFVIALSRGRAVDERRDVPAAQFALHSLVAVEVVEVDDAGSDVLHCVTLARDAAGDTWLLDDTLNSDHHKAGRAFQGGVLRAECACMLLPHYMRNVAALVLRRK